ncbi:MAG: sodium:calcium symporter [Planctomycetota bacterium]|nr:MAG: sodium:calcium symporter [Planctomycetota bacterium]
MNRHASKEHWGSRIGVIMAVMGSAVGLGNFLRFPGQAAQYGGGIFMIPYLVALVFLGLPLAWAEWAMGRYGGVRGYNSSPGIYRSIWKTKFAGYAGTLAILIPVVIYMYYVYIEAWCLAYAVRYLGGQMNFESAQAADSFFNSFVGANAGHGGEVLEHAFAGRIGFLESAVFFLIICFAVNFFLIYRGLTKGIEWFCRWAMPALIVCAVIVLVRVLTLGTPDPAHPDQNVLNGLGQMWNPVKPGETWMDALERLENPEIWLAAASQIFFSLSVGFGIIITYSSYLKRDDDIALSSLTAVAGNEFCEVVLGGLITIPAAFVFMGMSIIENPPGTFGMGFSTLPNVFSHMAYGNVFGFLFFFLLFLAAVTSSLSMLQPAIAFLEEGVGLKRHSSVTILAFITAMGAMLVVYYSAGFKALDTMDFWVGTFAIFLLATFQSVLFAWVLGVDKGLEELSRGAEIRVPRVFRYILKYITPFYLLLVLGGWTYQNIVLPMIETRADGAETPRLVQAVEDPIVRLVLLFLLFVGLIFALLVGQAMRRWDRAEQAREEVSI